MQFIVYLTNGPERVFDLITGSEDSARSHMELRRNKPFTPDTWFELCQYESWNAVDYVLLDTTKEGLK